MSPESFPIQHCFGAQVEEQIIQQVAEQFHGVAFTQQLVEQIKQDLFSVPWGHHMLLIDKLKNSPEKVEGTIPTIEEIEAKLSAR